MEMGFHRDGKCREFLGKSVGTSKGKRAGFLERPRPRRGLILELLWDVDPIPKMMGAGEGPQGIPLLCSAARSCLAAWNLSDFYPEYPWNCRSRHFPGPNIGIGEAAPPFWKFFQPKFFTLAARRVL